MGIHIVTGLPGSGKSFYTADFAYNLLLKNKKILLKTGRLRQVASNLKFSTEVEEEFLVEFEGVKYNLIKYWSDALTLPELKDVDIIWEEMGVICDARNWENLPTELKRWFQQHRHKGCEIYGNVQEFADVDVHVRRLKPRLI